MEAPGNGESGATASWHPSPGNSPFLLIKPTAPRSLRNQEWVAKAMKIVWQHLGLRLEPSGAVALGALLEQPELFLGQRILVTLTGGNVDDHRFSECLALAG